jgi:hypothetical protein
MPCEFLNIKTKICRLLSSLHFPSYDSHSTGVKLPTIFVFVSNIQMKVLAWSSQRRWNSRAMKSSHCPTTAECNDLHGTFQIAPDNDKWFVIPSEGAGQSSLHIYDSTDRIAWEYMREQHDRRVLLHECREFHSEKIRWIAKRVNCDSVDHWENDFTWPDPVMSWQFLDNQCASTPLNRLSCNCTIFDSSLQWNDVRPVSFAQAKRLSDDLVTQMLRRRSHRLTRIPLTMCNARGFIRTSNFKNEWMKAICPSNGADLLKHFQSFTTNLMNKNGRSADWWTKKMKHEFRDCHEWGILFLSIVWIYHHLFGWNPFLHKKSEMMNLVTETQSISSKLNFCQT